MIKSSIEKLSRDIGFDIGNSDDQVQADLLNGFCDGLATITRKFDADMQISYISDKLSPSTKRMILRISEYCEVTE